MDPIRIMSGVDVAAEALAWAASRVGAGTVLIHSTAHPEKAWVIRITGGDLDQVPRFRFHPKRDKILEKAAQ